MTIPRDVEACDLLLLRLHHLPECFRRDAPTSEDRSRWETMKGGSILRLHLSVVRWIVGRAPWAEVPPELSASPTQAYAVESNDFLPYTTKTKDGRQSQSRATIQTQAHESMQSSRAAATAKGKNQKAAAKSKKQQAKRGAESRSCGFESHVTSVHVLLKERRVHGFTKGYIVALAQT